MSNTAIIVSTPRSGSSWLSRILRDHPELNVYTHNTNNTQMLYLLYPIRMFNPVGDDSVEKKSVFDGLLKKVRIKTISSYYKNPTSDRLLVLASPTNVEFLPLLAQVFPTAKYVHLRRNPLDVVASFRKFLEENGKDGIRERYNKYKHQGPFNASSRVLAYLFHTFRWISISHPGYIGTRPTGFQEMAKRPILEFLCWYYFRLEEQIEHGLAQVPANRKYIVSYEDLVTNHETTLRNLYGFLNVSAPDQHLHKTSSEVKTTAIGRHETLFSSRELVEIKHYLLRQNVQLYGCSEQSQAHS